MLYKPSRQRASHSLSLGMPRSIFAVIVAGEFRHVVLLPQLLEQQLISGNKALDREYQEHLNRPLTQLMYGIGIYRWEYNNFAGCAFNWTAGVPGLDALRDVR